MDLRETLAMTEASGLTNQPDDHEHASDARSRPVQSPSQDAAIRWAKRLRKVTVKAPFQLRFAAFLLGIWVARRR